MRKTQQTKSTGYATGLTTLKVISVMAGCVWCFSMMTMHVTLEPMHPNSPPSKSSLEGLNFGAGRISLTGGKERTQEDGNVEVAKSSQKQALLRGSIRSPGELKKLERRDETIRNQAERILAQHIEIEELQRAHDASKTSNAVSTVYNAAETAAIPTTQRPPAPLAPPPSGTSATIPAHVDNAAPSLHMDTLSNLHSIHTPQQTKLQVADAPSMPSSSSSTTLRGKTEAGILTGKVVTSSGCEVMENIDFRTDPSGMETIYEGLTMEACGKRCVDLGTAKCSVAVYSSEHDQPPHACWVKSAVSKGFSKYGVQALIPPGHRDLPTIEIGKGLNGRIGGGGDGSGASDLRNVGNYAALFDLPGEGEFTKPGSLGSNGSGNDDRKFLGLKEAHQGLSREQVLEGRAAAIKSAMVHAWSNYRRLAWGSDNLMPLSGRGTGAGFNHAVTMIDSLDTLWLMDLKEEFNEARDWVAKHLKERIARLGGATSVFETTIRSLGGLLGAYDMSKDTVFLDLAQSLGDKISATTSEHGVTPYTFSGGYGGMGCPSLAESGTMQVEMNYLSKVSGNPRYAQKANAFYDTVQSQPSMHGLWPNCWQHGRGKITFGADGDSFYEYLIKGWLQTGRKKSNKLWQMYNAAVDGMQKYLVATGSDGLTYLNNFNMASSNGIGSVDVAMEHLACFVPGWLALGVPHQDDAARAAEHTALAEKLAYTCWQMYEQQPTGIGPERVKGMRMDLSRTDTKEYILRPEAVEGWWYMMELKGADGGGDKYREWGWRTFLNFERHLRVPHGYASIRDVRSRRPNHMDRMESFFLAETLKYLYLLQDPKRQIRPNTHVLNTEAHPFSLEGY